MSLEHTTFLQLTNAEGSSGLTEVAGKDLTTFDHWPLAGSSLELELHGVADRGGVEDDQHAWQTC